MYYQRPTRGAGLAELLGGVLTGLAQRHQNRLQERDEEAYGELMGGYRAAEKSATDQNQNIAKRKDELRPHLDDPNADGYQAAKDEYWKLMGQKPVEPDFSAVRDKMRDPRYARVARRRGLVLPPLIVGPPRPTEPNPGAASPTPEGQGMAPGGDGKQSGALAVPGLPEKLAAQLPDPRWRSRQQDSGGFQPFGNLGPAGPGGGQLVLARYLAANPGGGGVAGAPGLGPAVQQLRGRSPRAVAGSGGRSGSPAAQERVQKLVATWEDLHGQAATDAIRSQIADYVRTA